MRFLLSRHKGQAPEGVELEIMKALRLGDSVCERQMGRALAAEGCTGVLWGDLGG